MSPGEILRAWREKAGLTQAELATVAAMKRTYVGDVEADRFSPTVRTLLRLIDAIERS